LPPCGCLPARRQRRLQTIRPRRSPAEADGRGHITARCASTARPSARRRP
jgi:hypothetical protein